jgi:hypothetical protein
MKREEFISMMGVAFDCAAKAKSALEFAVIVDDNRVIYRMNMNDLEKIRTYVLQIPAGSRTVKLQIQEI